MKKVLGLDLGTTSIGWALVNEAESEKESSSIIKLGVRVNPLTVDEQLNFNAGKPITTNADRTLKRSMRRNLQRYKLRRSALLEELRNNGIITSDAVLTEDGPNTTFQTWSLRSKAAVEEISLEEFARVLLQINKKRGYRSSRKVNSGEDGQLIDGMEVAQILANEMKTPGQYSYELLKQGKKHLPDYYRSDLVAEFDRVWSKQSSFYPELNGELREELRAKNGKQTWAIIAQHFNLVGVKRQGKKDEIKLENYLWRVQALTQRIDTESLAVVLQEINSQISASSGYLSGISDHSKELFFNKQTVGQYQYAELLADRHHSLANETFYRQDYLDEFNHIWDIQAKFHKELTPELKSSIRDIVIFYQRPLKSQKGLVSLCELEHWKTEISVDGKTRTKVVGQKVCPKSSPTYQEFRIWQRLNDLIVTEKSTDEQFALSDDEKVLLAEELNFKEVLKKTELLEILFGKSKAKKYDLNFKEVVGNRTQAQLLKAYSDIIYMAGYDETDFAKMRASEIKEMLTPILRSLGVVDGLLEFNTDAEGREYDEQPLFRLWHLLYSYEGDNSKTGDESLVKKLEESFGFSAEYAKVISRISFEPDYGSLSSRAIKKILPFMKEGQQYSDACVSAGYRHSASSLTAEENQNRTLKDKLEILPKNSLRNPVVEKILNQMIHVVNSVVENYGRPDEIRIEMARELKQNAAEREKATRSIADASRAHEKYREILQKEFGMAHVSRNDIIRYKLYLELEANGFKTLYSNTYIPREDIFSKKFDIEHIIPQSKCFDDSFANKTLEARDVNIKKGNATALDFVKDAYGEQGMLDYKARVSSMSSVMSATKIKNLLRTDDEISGDFIARDLRDTQYIAKMAKDILLQIVRDVVPTTGKITDRLREDWQLVDIMRELNWDKYDRLGLTDGFDNRDGQRIHRIKDWTKRNDHRHHAMDALTIAFTKRSIVQYLSTLNARSDKTSLTYAIEQKEMLRDSWNHLVFRSPILPVAAFRAEAKSQLENVLVSIKAKNKVVTRNTNVTKKKGGTNKVTQLTPRAQLHNETVYGTSTVYNVKEEKIGAGFDLEKINTVVNGSFRVALLRRLQEFGGDPKLAFTGKNALAKNPVFADDAKTVAVPEKVKTSTPETIYTCRKPVNSDLKVDKVIDANVRRILEERLAEYGGDAKKAFNDLDNNPIWLNKEAGIAIKRVTIKGVNNVVAFHEKKDHKGNVIRDQFGNKLYTDFVSTSGNHHVAIYQDEDGNLQERVVSFFEATDRAVHHCPIVDRDYQSCEGWHLLFTMKQNEYFVFPNPATGFDPSEIDLMNPENYALISPNLFRVQKIASKDYCFRHHLETTVQKDLALQGVTWKRLQSLVALKGLVKVRVDHIGRIVAVGEY